MASIKEYGMKISWILSNSLVLDPTVDIDQLKNIGAFWGSWRTWRSCQTDNVICHDMAKANELIKRAFHAVCNFYIPNSIYASLDRPTGVKLYEGDFIHDVDRHEEIVAMHLVASASEIVLMMGFDFSEPVKNLDKLVEHRETNYRNLTKQAMIDNPNTQWVMVDHPAEFRKDLQKVANLSRDSLENVIGMLAN
jgi:hypothetical protein